MSLSQEKQAELKKLFASYDVNNDGVITSEELKQAFAKLGQKVSDDDIIAMMAQADLDGNGKIDCNEFLKMMSKTI